MFQDRGSTERVAKIKPTASLELEFLKICTSPPSNQAILGLKLVYDFILEDYVLHVLYYMYGTLTLVCRINVGLRLLIRRIFLHGHMLI